MFTLNCKGRLLVVDKPLVMGIINATPDSFYDKSRFTGPETVLAQVESMLGEGADIIDIGGQSTRPGSQRVSEKEELSRVIGPIESIIKKFPDTIISIDTYYSTVAAAAIAAGASIVNDVSAGSLDDKMHDTVAGLKVPYVLMHMKGNPSTMQVDPHYENVSLEVLDFLRDKKELLRKKGITDIIIDPGFGFGKTIRHNFQLIKDLSTFKMLECPILFGISRKSTIYKTLDISADEALNGTSVLNTIALLNGASILRVHDVRAAKEAITLTGEVYP